MRLPVCLEAPTAATRSGATDDLRRGGANSAYAAPIDQPALLLVSKQRCDNGAPAARTPSARRTGAASRRGSARRSTSTIARPCAAKQPIERGQREVAQVLVVDRVELAVVEHVLDVRHLDHRHAVRLQQRPDAGDEAVQIGDVGEHVVGVEDVGALPVCRQPLAQASRRRTRDASGCPARSATAAMFRAGSMPSTGHARCAA